MDKEFEITCQVPYYSRFCYIKDTEGRVVHSDYGISSSLGKCNLSVKKAEKRHAGQWNCYFATGSGLEDDNIVVDVSP